MRYRSRGEGPVTSELVLTANGNYHSSRLCTVADDREEIWDVVTEDFKKKSAAGVIINNNCSYSKVELTQVNGPGTYRVTCGAGTEYETVYETSGGSVTEWLAENDCSARPWHDDLTLDWQHAVDQAKQYALAQVDASPYEFGEDIGELRETIRFLRDPFRSLLDLGRSFRKDRQRYLSKHRAKSVAEATSDVWLSYRFAASPLVRSAQSALEAYNDYQVKSVQRRTARGFSRLNESANDTVEMGGDPPYAAHTVISRAISVSYNVRAGILYEVKNPVQDVRFHLGLRTKDIPKVVWQLMPYSFMVDRVSNISNSVAGVVNLIDPNVKIKSAWVTMMLDRKWQTSSSKSYNSSVTDCSGTITPDVLKKHHFNYDRVVWKPSLSDAFVSGKPEGLVKDLTSTTDLIALCLKQFL